MRLSTGGGVTSSDDEPPPATWDPKYTQPVAGSSPNVSFPYDGMLFHSQRRIRQPRALSLLSIQLKTLFCKNNISRTAKNSSHPICKVYAAKERVLALTLRAEKARVTSSLEGKPCAMERAGDTVSAKNHRTGKHLEGKGAGWFSFPGPRMPQRRHGTCGDASLARTDAKDGSEQTLFVFVLSNLRRAQSQIIGPIPVTLSPSSSYRGPMSAPPARPRSLLSRSVGRYQKKTKKPKKKKNTAPGKQPPISPPIYDDGGLSQQHS